MHCQGNKNVFLVCSRTNDNGSERLIKLPLYTHGKKCKFWGWTFKLISDFAYILLNKNCFCQQGLVWRFYIKLNWSMRKICLWETLSSYVEWVIWWRKVLIPRAWHKDKGEFLGGKRIKQEPSVGGRTRGKEDRHSTCWAGWEQHGLINWFSWRLKVW